MREFAREIFNSRNIDDISLFSTDFMEEVQEKMAFIDDMRGEIGKLENLYEDDAYPLYLYDNHVNLGLELSEVYEILDNILELTEKMSQLAHDLYCNLIEIAL